MSANASSPLRQRGVAALEFGLTMMVLFIVLFAVVSYGALFWAKQRVSFAAGEGARAVLEGSLAGPVSPLVGCVRATQAAGFLVVSCEPRRQACGWSGASLDCVAIVVSFDIARWPMVGALQQVGALVGGDESRWMPDAVWGRAVVQVKPEALL